jgi:hypothetical protein
MKIWTEISKYIGSLTSSFICYIIVNFEECYHPKAKLYTGNISVTHNGRQCQRWDSQFPHKHEFTKKSKFPDKTLTEAANFCRSPDNNHTPWCFTEDPLVPWEYCGINSCPTGMLLN